MIELRKYITEGIFDMVDMDANEMSENLVKEKVLQIYKNNPNNVILIGNKWGEEIGIRNLLAYNSTYRKMYSEQFRQIMSGSVINEIAIIQEFLIHGDDSVRLSDCNEHPVHIKKIDILAADMEKFDIHKTEVSVNEIRFARLWAKKAEDLVAPLKYLKKNGTKIEKIHLRSLYRDPVSSFTDVVKGMEVKESITIDSSILPSRVFQTNFTGHVSSLKIKREEFNEYITEFFKYNKCTSLRVNLEWYRLGNATEKMYIVVKDSKGYKLKLYKGLA